MLSLSISCFQVVFEECYIMFGHKCTFEFCVTKAMINTSFSLYLTYIFLKTQLNKHFPFSPRPSFAYNNISLHVKP